MRPGLLIFLNFIKFSDAVAVFSDCNEARTVISIKKQSHTFLRSGTVFLLKTGTATGNYFLYSFTPAFIMTVRLFSGGGIGQE